MHMQALHFLSMSNCLKRTITPTFVLHCVALKVLVPYTGKGGYLALCSGVSLERLQVLLQPEQQCVCVWVGGVHTGVAIVRRMILYRQVLWDLNA